MNNPLQTDTQILDWIERKKLQICFNDRIGKYTVQAYHQVGANMGEGATLREAVENAILNKLWKLIESEA